MGYSYYYSGHKLLSPRMGFPKAVAILPHEVQFVIFINQWDTQTLTKQMSKEELEITMNQYRADNRILA